MTRIKLSNVSGAKALFSRKEKQPRRKRDSIEIIYNI